ncbi:laccase 1 precursor [Roridomyces roridus]|uniref:Laccase 1 n=1 Tax=Roridomyces roridus TaxID=1738132 RepID=A0AAD7F9K0_9AGAR|nr:laccase 1 precursor [Roridomyces roridus]
MTSSLASAVLVASLLSGTALAAIGPTATLNIVNKQISPDGFQRSSVLANSVFPGPLITGTKGASFDLNVVNQLTDPTMLRSTSIHWHGFFQAGSSWEDGPAFVTQCPIAANHSFDYQFDVPEQTGTFWYHSHLSTQYCDGLRGPFVVYDPNDPAKSLYDVDNDATVITLADWQVSLPRAVSPLHTLINGLGRYMGGPASTLAVISVTKGTRYRFRLVAISCDPNWVFSIDGHSMTVIEVDGVNVQPLVVDNIQIFAGQRYSFVLNATDPQNLGNYWVRANPDVGNAGFAAGINSAILRYSGAASSDPTSSSTLTNALVETNLHPLVPTPVPGKPTPGGADMVIPLPIALTANGTFSFGGASFVPPTAPVLLQILSGAQTAQDILPAGSIYSLPPNSAIEISIPGGAPGAPHPIHLHGHNFFVVRSAGNATYNFVDPVIRDVVSTGPDTTDLVTIRFETNNAGPWFLHCHIDWHLDIGLAVVMAEDIPTIAKADPPASWDNLCPIYDSLTPGQL